MKNILENRIETERNWSQKTEKKLKFFERIEQKLNKNENIFRELNRNEKSRIETTLFYALDK